MKLEPRLRDALIHKRIKKKLDDMRLGTSTGREKIKEILMNGFVGYKDVPDEELLQEMADEALEDQRKNYYSRDLPPGLGVTITDEVAFIQHLTVREVEMALTDANQA